MRIDNLLTKPARSNLSPSTDSRGLNGELKLHRTEEAAPFLEDIAATLIALGYSPRDCMGIRLALEEAIVNGICHGNHSDPTKRVRVRYHVSAEDVLVEVEDEGPGFDLDRVSDPTVSENLELLRGRGLLLMCHYMTWVRVLGRGNRILLYKRRPGQWAGK